MMMKSIMLIAVSLTSVNAHLLLNRALTVGKCGVPAIKPDTSTDIVGGKDSIPHSWPWQVFVTRGCGATLITNQWVLTAAHCITNRNPEYNSVRLGVFDRTKQEPGQVPSKVIEVHVHPNYSSPDSWNSNDIALLKLEKPVEFTDHISPICLPTVQDELPPAGTNTFIIGWGNTKVPSRDASPTVKQVMVPLVAQETCKARNPIKFSEKVEICVGFDKGGKGACHGDSGGPALIQNSDGSWTQIGVTSWVHNGECAGPTHSVYGKVSAFLDFIRQYVKDV